MQIRVNRISLNRNTGIYSGQDKEFMVEKNIALKTIKKQPPLSSQSDGYEYMIWNDANNEILHSFHSSDPQPFFE